MRAIVCTELKGPDSLQLLELPDPKPDPGTLVIDVKAAALNFPDVLITWGKYQTKPKLPFSPGGEGAGVVSAVGDGVEGYSVGDKVFFIGTHGAFAERVALPAMVVAKMPPGVDYRTAAALTMAYGTSYHAFKQRADLKPGETVAVLGAAGGVGLAAVELAKAMGAKVIACASTDEKLQVCKAAGADELLNYGQTDLKTELKQLAPKGVDVVYDPVGGDYSEPAIRSLRAGGRHLVIGFAAGNIPAIPLNLTLLKQSQIVGVFWGAWVMANPREHGKNMVELFQMMAKGQIKPRVEDVYKLEHYREAYACLIERRVKGKVVLDVGI